MAAQHEGLEWKKNALRAIEALETRLDSLERAKREPIAVIGLACRVPGASDSDAFWRLLDQGVDAISEIPADRFDVDDYYDPDPDAPGKMSTRYGGFLAQVDRFDAQLFGISPREAVSMDPQHRLLLEVSWEALEHAGLSADSLRGSRTGVFVGISSSDYAHLLGVHGASAIDAYMASGVAYSTGVGRISYVLGLEGPNLAIDTACSSSLVAVHQACQSLLSGESDLALAGGVNVILTPPAMIFFSKARMLAPDGRCKTFDATANGFARGEGCGMVVLKRLSDAQRDGDRILAVIRGSAVNQDGASSGLMVPNGPAQERVIRRALEQAGVEPQEVSYLEAHGTGTSLGDPIEVQAAAAALGADRPADRPLLVGSVKTNVGHLEAAAGIAGFVKVVLALQHERIPPHLHFHQPNPHIPWQRLPVQVVSQSRPWPEGRRLAGVSSFGFSGTNAHVVLEGPPAREVRVASSAAVAREHHLLPLSAKSEAALRQMAGRYLKWCEDHPEASVADIGFSAATGRSHLPWRAAVVCSSQQQARSALEQLGRGQPATGLFTGHAHGRPKLAWLFTGQGSQYAGMGQELYATQPVFREVLDRCAELLGGQLGRPLLEALFERDALLADTRYAQPALFAVELALARLWQSWGIEPDVVVGHSVGEYAAACVAGVFELEQGLRLIAERGVRMGQVSARGAMGAVFADAEQVADATRGHAELSVAAYNGAHTVVSGAAEAVEQVLAEFRARGIRCERLNTSQAFHSALIEPALEPLEALAGTLEFHPARRTLISNLTGRPLASGQVLDAAYWRRQAREPVQFARSLQSLADLGVETLLEIGPQPVLLGMAAASWPAGSPPVRCIPSLRRDKDDTFSLAAALGQLYVQGITPDFRAFDRPWPRRKLSLPTYPFQQQRYWTPPPRRMGLAVEGTHPLLGTRQELASGQVAYTQTLSCTLQPWLRDHRVYDAVVAPAAFYLSLALCLHDLPCGLADVTFQHALLLDEQDANGLELQLTLDGPSPGKARTFQFFSRRNEGWTLHAQGALLGDQGDMMATEVNESIQSLRDRLEERSVATFYEHVAEAGIQFGPSFQGLVSLWVGQNEALGEIAAPADAPAGAWHVHPAVLDACLQVAGAVVPGPEGTSDSAVYVPFEIGALHVSKTTEAARFYCYCRRHASSRADAHAADLWLLDEQGRAWGRIQNLVVVRATRETLLRDRNRQLAEWLYDVEWQEQPRRGPVLSAGFLSAPAVIAQSVRQVMPRLLKDAGVPEDDGDFLVRLEHLSRQYIVRALDALGCSLTVGQTVSAEELLRRLGILPAYGRLLSRLLQILADDGTLVRDGQQWRVARLVDKVDPEALRKSLNDRYAGARTELTLLGRCGARLAEVLTGCADPLGLLFPQEGIGAEDLYHSAPSAKVLNGLVRSAIQKAIEGLPGERRLRVLEIGAGTGGTTDAVLSILPAERTEYVYSDISAGFFSGAEARFAEYPYLTYRTLDIERDPGEQGFTPHQFDIVLAAHVLHATRDLKATLSNVRQLLAPEGLLVLLEGLRRSVWADLTFGLLEGWWRFDDAVRTDYALLGFEQWSELLCSEGFAEPTRIAPENVDEAAVIIVRGPAAAAVASTIEPGSWLILTDRQGVGERLAARLHAANQRCLLVERGDTSESLGEARSQVAADDAGSWEHLLRAELAHEPPLRGVVHLWSIDAATSDTTTAETLADDTRLGCGSVLSLSQALVHSALLPPSGLWLVTRGGQSVDGDVSSSIGQSPLWGMGTVLAVEHPELACRRVDVDSRDSSTSLQLLVDDLLSPDYEDQIVFRGQRRLVPRLRRHMSAGEPGPPTFSASGTYVITGGLGGLGLAVARWMVERGARHLVLNGRRAPNKEAETVLAQLREAGAEVRVILGDVAKPSHVEDMIRQIDSGLPPLRGVIHGAGVLSNGMLMNQSWERFEEVLGPKVQGSWNLHQLTAGRPLDFFVMFSSMAALLGSPGQANHAAANMFLDVLSRHRRSLGLTSTSINWAAWSEIGAAARHNVPSQMEQAGLGWIRPEQGLSLLEVAMQGEAAQVAAAPIDWSVMRRQFSDAPVPPLLANMLQSAPQQQRQSEPAGRFWQRLQQAPAEERRPMLIRHLQEQVAQVLRLSSLPDPSAGFSSLGMDSLMAVELHNRLQRQLGSQPALSSTLLFDHPNVIKLAEYLAARLPATPGQRQKPTWRRAQPHEPIAVVGLGCRVPGASDSDAFWRLLDQGVDAVGKIPADRFDVEAYYDPDPDAPGKMSTRYGGFLDQVDQFDPELFGISPSEAVSMDPQQRLLLEVSWEALEHAALAPRGLSGSKTGVFIGLNEVDYVRLRDDEGGLDIHVAAGSAASFAAGRLSYVFGLEGPSQTIDTACSSSLVCVHQACQSLRMTECDLALAGGAHLILTPATFMVLSRAHMLAPDGRCKTFDATADGFTRGEGCGIVVLKRLADAERDGDRILAVIRGSAVNHEGAASGIAVPNGPAQTRVIRDALEQAGIAPGEVDYLEAHGTGTSLGDPIEVQAAAAALREGRPAERPLLLGSVKTNVGHLEAAAGIAGLIKVVLALQHGRIPRHLHFRDPNPHIPWAELPVRVTQEATLWPKARRIAGVSAFGFSGTNAHVVLEGAAAPEAAPAEAEAPTPAPHVLVLSAKTEAALQALAVRYAAWWAEHPKAALGDVSFTLATGRSHLEQRAALVAGSAAEAGALLAALAAGRPAPGLYTGRAAAWPPGATPPALLASLRRGADDERQLAETLAQLYVHGVTADFAALHARRPGRRLSLPSYPFQRQRYWTPPPRRRKLAV